MIHSTTTRITLLGYDIEPVPCEFDVDYDACEPDVGYRGGWGAELITMTLGGLKLDRYRVKEMIGPDELERIEAEAAGEYGWAV